MPDQIFENPRLADIYDAFDGARDDLCHYLAIARELNAKSVLDVGCGTGTFACLLAENGFDVTGLEPAKASLNVARHKPGAEHIQWILGDTGSLPPLKVDLAIMTGNVAQVFVTDEGWERNLLDIREALHPSGHLVFEVRDPAKKAWLNWTREKTFARKEIPDTGFVHGWCEVTSASEDFVSFRWTYVFESTGEALSSDSTLRFRKRDEILLSLERTGYSICEIRDAPDRPGLEFVFIASAP